MVGVIIEFEITNRIGFEYGIVIEINVRFKFWIRIDIEFGMLLGINIGRFQI